MLLGPAQKMRLSVKSADMHVDVVRDAVVDQRDDAMSASGAGY
jgi:hypothetical protein